MIQSTAELESWYRKEDPWGYNKNPEDIKRKEILLSEIPNKNYKHVLDIGCGEGFITKDLPGDNIYGFDVSQSAINFARKNVQRNIIFKQGSIFEIQKLIDVKFDLVVITGVLYPQYIGKASNLIYLLIDSILNKGGNLVSVHIHEWYESQFPYLRIKQMFYDYREYVHNLEIYTK
ncbi:methyltransferase domain-containing protein [Salinimicrobium oceani]|uniref:Class I SAM-dependent methyltransferase n=1 Tax=Salinimicrobium oceani TaxID=2722702 RepID=A0ABX1D0K7_9FLAO|nr:methyltransferase domain-containing protein [Salinimicrobium oceani]NJW54048.1 class I SAM-dependent methyltransferase [Salinimicrobium oceani]